MIKKSRKDRISSHGSWILSLGLYLKRAAHVTALFFFYSSAYTNTYFDLPNP